MSGTPIAAAAVVTAAALTRFVTGVFARAGMPDADATTVAEVLVWANLRGVDSHGVVRAPRYVALIEAGDVNPRPVLTARIETAAAVLIEADRAAGPVALTAAMRAAAGKAREAGIGLALVRGTTHTAALGYYTLLAAREGLAALALSASTPLMAYHGARAAGVSTNPIAIAVPGGAHGPLGLDMATGVFAMGKLLEARWTGQALPPGSALDRHGAATTDPRAAEILLPMAGPKGSGLSLMIECLTSLVVSNAILAEALAGAAPGRRRRHTQNALALAIDLARFGDPAAFRAEVDRLVGALKALPRAPGVEEILMPGERAARTAERRRRNGIPLPAPVVQELAHLARRLDVPLFPFDTPGGAA
jgi:LDH2 family malate/lactate/ureidoglycolate dehydrogenase